MAERAGVHLDAANVPRGMADVVRLVMANRFQFRFGKKSAIRQHRVKRLDRMAFALDVTVARRAAESFRRHVEDAVVEHVQDVEARKPAAGVPRARADDGFERQLAQADGFELEFAVGHGPHPELFKHPSRDV